MMHTNLRKIFAVALTFEVAMLSCAPVSAAPCRHWNDNIFGQYEYVEIAPIPIGGDAFKTQVRLDGINLPTPSDFVVLVKHDAIDDVGMRWNGHSFTSEPGVIQSTGLSRYYKVCGWDLMSLASGTYEIRWISYSGIKMEFEKIKGREVFTLPWQN